MRLVSFQHEHKSSFGVVTAAGIVDGGARLPEYTSLRQVIADDATDRLRNLTQDGYTDFAIEDVTLLPVIPDPDKIICVGINYRPHVEETGRDIPDHPVLFTRFSDSQVGHEQPLVVPSLSHRLDYEGELAVVIGRSGRHIPRHGALHHVAGYAAFNDGSVRDYQGHTSQFTPGKNFAASGSFGPWLTTSDEIGDPRELTLQTRLNGEVMQQASVSDLIFDVQALIAYISSFCMLLPGDVIVTGTPGGVGFVRRPPVYLKAGDQVEVDISGIGILRNPVIDEVTSLSG